ncbi:MAG: ester cyclase [Acidimicrobiia bacterium]|nr:ester cyclase [Acidimicrobiia bacterium]
MSTANISTARRLFEQGWGGRNLRVFDETCHRTMVNHDPVSPDLKPGLDAVKENASGYFTAFPDLTFTIEDIIDAGDKVIVRYTGSGTHKGPLAGVAPTNKRVSAGGITILRFQGDKVAESWAYWDALGLMRQLGAVPLAAKAGR